jgi:hypothetical protein
MISPIHLMKERVYEKTHLDSFVVSFMSEGI